MRRSILAPYPTPLAAAVAAVLVGAPAAAAGSDPPEPSPPAVREHLPASVEEPREGWLAAHGIELGLVSRADVLSRVQGGLSGSHAPRYRGHIDFVTTLDLEKLGLWSGGTVVLVAQNGHGQGISERHVGDVQLLSNIDAHSFTQMSEWYLEQALFHGRLRLKVGRQDSAVDFGLVDFGAEFLNASFGVIPTNPLPTFPDPALGVSAFAEVTEEVTLGVGVYSATPIRWGLLRGTTFGAEVAWAPGAGGGAAGTRYRAGAWYMRDPLDAGDPGTSSFYAALDQVLYREGGSDQGLSGFLQVGTSTGAPNGVSDYVGAGLLYSGLIPGRDEDRVGVGVAHARLPARAGAGPTETDIELLYRLSPWSWITLQPSLHWVLSPGGEDRTAVVAGLRIEVAF
jgi:porin